MKTPLLVMFGDNDGTVHWHPGVELYNIDYHHRIVEWFDHYLAGQPAAPWIESGEKFIDRERDLQQRKLPAKDRDVLKPVTGR
jgi:hypothetical protein